MFGRFFVFMIVCLYESLFDSSDTVSIELSNFGTSFKLNRTWEKKRKQINKKKHLSTAKTRTYKLLK